VIAQLPTADDESTALFANDRTIRRRVAHGHMRQVFEMSAAAQPFFVICDHAGYKIISTVETLAQQLARLGTKR